MRRLYAPFVLVILCVGCSRRPYLDESRVVDAKCGPFEVAVVEGGELHALTQTTITSKVSGKIEWLLDEGTHVEAGDLLVELEKQSYEEELEKSQEELKDAETHLEDLIETLEAQEKELEEQVRVAEVALKVAELRLQMLEEEPTEREKEEAAAELESATLLAKQGDIDLKRTQALAERGIVSQNELNQAELKAKIASARLEAAQFAYETLLKGPPELEMREARIAAESARLERALAGETFALEKAKLEGLVEERRAEVKKIRSKIRRLEAKIESRTLRAPHEGIVMYRKLWQKGTRSAKVEVGSNVWPGMGLMELPDLRKMEVATQVSEFVIRYVKVGDTVTVKVDLIPEETYTGRIVWIDRWGRDKNLGSNDADKRRLGLAGFNVFAVEVEILEEDPRLKLGFKARCKIPIKRLDEAVYVPKEAIFIRDHRPHVRMVKRGSIVAQEVVLGEENEDSFTIASGLVGGEKVLVR